MSGESLDAVFSRLEDEEQQWIETQLESLEMVLWDRYIIETDPRDAVENGFVVGVYGWIDREEDDYKDFVVVRFWTDGRNVSFTTSSEEHSSEIHSVLFEDDDEEKHNTCRRVETAMDVSNAVTISEQQTFDTYAND